MRCLPELPDFQLSLRPEEFELPEIEAGSSEGNQTHLLSEHLEDYSDNHDDEDDDDKLDHRAALSTQILLSILPLIIVM